MVGKTPNLYLNYKPYTVRVRVNAVTVDDSVRKKPRKKRVKRLNDHPRLASKSVRILDMIESKGDAGMTTTQIRKALWAMTYPDDPPGDWKNVRGYWSTNLTGSNVRNGLLTFFCTKKGRRWVRNAVSHENQPWRVMDRHNQYKHPSRAKSSWQMNWSYGSGIVNSNMQAFVTAVDP